MIRVAGMVTSAAWITNRVTSFSPLKHFGSPEFYFSRKFHSFLRIISFRIVQEPQGLIQSKRVCAQSDWFSVGPHL